MLRKTIIWCSNSSLTNNAKSFACFSIVNYVLVTIIVIPIACNLFAMCRFHRIGTAISTSLCAEISALQILIPACICFVATVAYAHVSKQVQQKNWNCSYVSHYWAKLLVLLKPNLSQLQLPTFPTLHLMVDFKLWKQAAADVGGKAQALSSCLQQLYHKISCIEEHLVTRA